MMPSSRSLAMAMSLGCALSLAAPAPGCAQTAPSTQTPTTEPLAPVTVQGLKRDSTMMAYAETNEMLKRLRDHGHGLFDIEFQLDSQQGEALFAQARLGVQTDRRLIPIALSPDRRFHLPVLDADEAKDADLATNLPRRSQLSVRGSIRLTTPPTDLDMATVRRIVATSHRLRSELLPWYVRWLFPRMDGVRICADQAPIELEWRERGQLMGLSLPTAPTETDGKSAAAPFKRHCTVLTGQEAWPDSARLLARDGMTLSIHSR